MSSLRKKTCVAVATLVCVPFATGCATTAAHRHELDQHGYVFYADGAGGAGVLTNWGRGVQQGLKQGGYAGDFENFVWQTGLGPGPDQSMSVEDKRQKAAALADRISEYQRSHPDKPVAVIGLSAGTALAVFAVEALPENQPVDCVILLGSSLSSHYDLSRALKRVRGKVYVFTSDNDAVLNTLVPLAGTADREYCGACSAGLKGFHESPNDSAEKRRLYAKVENIAWRPEFAEAGNYGWHTDAVNPRFVRKYILPLVEPRGPRFVIAAQSPSDPPAPDAAEDRS